MRRHDLDSLRVIAFALLILYHVGIFFVPWWFHIKNDITYEALVIPMQFLNQWRLSLLFVISGMGTFYALNKRTGKQFAVERLQRFFIPFIFGMFVIVPPQIYLERLDKGQFDGNYCAFWPSQIFNGPYPEGNISWHHLWFVLYLLIFSLMLIPVFLYLRKHTSIWIITKLRQISARPWGLYVLIIPLFLFRIFLAHRFPQTNALVNDWYNLASYCCLFFCGFLLISLKDTFWQSVIRHRYIYLSVAAAAFMLLLFLWYVARDFPFRSYVEDFVRAANTWSWILTLFGFAAMYLNKPRKALTYANEAVYPFYILHQTMIIIIGYYLKDVAMGFFSKFAVMVAGTFVICFILYEYVIRRISWLRPLFGLKSRSNKS